MPALVASSTAGALSSSSHPRCQPASTSPRCSTTSTARPQHKQQRAPLSVCAAAPDNCRDKVSAPKAPVQTKGTTYKLTFVGAGGATMEIDCRDDQYILDAADEAGLDLPATCRGGICGACVARVASGRVDQSDVDDLSFTLNEDEQAAGMALLCMARACSDLTIETQSDWGYSLGIAEWKGATGRFSAAPDPLMGDKWSEVKS